MEEYHLCSTCIDIDVLRCHAVKWKMLSAVEILLGVDNSILISISFYFYINVQISRLLLKHVTCCLFIDETCADFFCISYFSVELSEFMVSNLTSG